MDLSIFLVRYRLKITVIPAIRELAPAKAGGGIQSFKARAPCGYWIPAFAGMTNIVARDLFRTVVRLHGNDNFMGFCVSPTSNRACKKADPAGFTLRSTQPTELASCCQSAKMQINDQQKGTSKNLLPPVSGWVSVLWSDWIGSDDEECGEEQSVCGI